MEQNRLERAYLQHLLIAAEVRDFSAPFRTFFDNWFAFHMGGPFLNRSSRPHWFNNPCPDRHGEALRRAHFVSAAAARTLSQLTRERLVKDHAIPVVVLRNLLFEARPTSTDEVRSFLLEYYRIGIITEAEHALLSAAGLSSRMPEGWQCGDAALSRYGAAAIVAQEVTSLNRGRCPQDEPAAAPANLRSKVALLSTAGPPRSLLRDLSWIDPEAFWQDPFDVYPQRGYDRSAGWVRRPRVLVASTSDSTQPSPKDGSFKQRIFGFSYRKGWCRLQDSNL